MYFTVFLNKDDDDDDELQHPYSFQKIAVRRGGGGGEVCSLTSYILLSLL